jgi:hypothetical protein
MFAIFHSKLYVCDFPEEEEEGSKFEALSLSLSLCIDIDMCMRKGVRRGRWKHRYVGLSEFRRRELFSVGYHLRGGGK